MSEPLADDFPPLESLLDGASFESADTPTPEEQPELVNGKRPRKKRSDAGQPRGPRGSTGTRKPRTGMTAADKKLADELLNPLAKIITGLQFVAPTAAGVLSMRGEATTQGLVSLASPKMKEALAKVSKTGPGLDLAETVLLMVIAFAVDFGRVEPDSPIALLTGVRKVYEETHPEKAAERNAPADAPFSPGNVAQGPGAPFGMPFPGAVA
jgi:hypothetical protein